MSDYPFQQLIGGRWVDAIGGGVWELIDPATEETIQSVPFGGDADAEAAIYAAHSAFQSWSRTTPYERAAVLEGAADWIGPRLDELAQVTTEESGKPFSEARAEWASARNYLTWFAGEGIRAYGRTIPARKTSRRIQVIYQPLGVVATITAWNFPIYNNVRTWAAALAAGCTVVGRPAEHTPRSGMLLAQALHEAGAPDGVMNLVNGEPEAMGKRFLDDPRVRKIAFTGSPRVGKILMDGASRTMTKLALELGGNAPVLVFPDIRDVAATVKTAVTWKYRNAGQVCVAPQRFFVHEDVAEAFQAEAVAVSRSLRLGHGMEPDTDVGPLINARQRERVEELVAVSSERGARVLTGGERPAGKGWFYRPTVVTDVGPGMPVYDDEIFGPVMPIIPFSDETKALEMANAGEHGLAAFVLTNDLNTSIRVSEQLEYGMVSINDWLPATPEAPFGGMKGSGVGRETGLEGLYEYLEEKTIFTGEVS